MTNHSSDIAFKRAGLVQVPHCLFEGGHGIKLIGKPWGRES